MMGFLLCGQNTLDSIRKWTVRAYLLEYAMPFIWWKFKRYEVVILQFTVSFIICSYCVLSIVFNICDTNICICMCVIYMSLCPIYLSE